MSKYEKLEAEYNLLSTPEQQWAWVLAHKDQVKLFVGSKETICVTFKKAVQWDYIEIKSPTIVSLLSVLGIEAEEV